MDHEYLPYLRLKTADHIADLLLFDKKDKHGIPLIHHCRRVRDACKDLSDDQRIAAVLHDVLEENSPAGLETLCTVIGRLFGAEVLRMVLGLTRRHTTYMDYIRHLAEYFPLAIPIKLADITDNLDPSRGPIPKSLKKRYLEAQAYLQERLRAQDSENPSSGS